MTRALVIGAGPAGLMAADVLAAGGCSVTLADAMPSVGRKFLMAGKSGLNLTKNEPLADFIAACGPLPQVMVDALTAFGPTQVMDWALRLGQPVFTGSSGRVFPETMKASPLLRALLHRLGGAGVQLQTRWRWAGWDGVAAVFDTPDGRHSVTAEVTILAMGGASWQRLGSDGAWTQHLADAVVPFAPANIGFAINWSPHMTAYFGHPVKACALIAGNQHERGEFVISQRGIEGGGVYAVSRAVREGASLFLDLLPDWTLAEITAKLSRPHGKETLANHLRKTLRLDPLRLALLNEWGRPLPVALAPLLKRLPIRHAGPRPLDEAISTAGGLRFDALDGLMLRARPSVFCAGEMLDWEAPTGGYLITGCLATGRAAALAALNYVATAR